ncbi:MAG: EVE domain-containing protein [Verrucomicrobia bacterium]|nr:MAG: EVE domain-containing protein [Verrucomicrobiota bacterium]
MSHWLIKSEPEVFGIADLARVRCEPWSGVRNYQARNFMWKDMQPGELALFYHSNAKPPGIVGVARVAGPPRPDPTQFDPAGEYFDAKAKASAPRWWLVDFEYVATLPRMLTLTELKADPTLAAMAVCQRGSRLSINPVSASHFARVCQLGGWDGAGSQAAPPPLVPTPHGPL